MLTVQLQPSRVCLQNKVPDVALASRQRNAGQAWPPGRSPAMPHSPKARLNWLLQAGPLQAVESSRKCNS